MELIAATKEDNTQKVKELMSQKDIDVNYGDPYYHNWTSLHLACSRGNLEIVIIFLQDIRVDVNKQDNELGITPFYLACQDGKTRVVNYMIQYQKVDINKPNNDSKTPIWIASDNGYTQVVQAILQSGRKLNLDAKYENKTALEQANEKGRQEIVKLLNEYISIHPDHFKEFLESQFITGQLDIIRYGLKDHITTLLSLFSTYHTLTSIK